MADVVRLPATEELRARWGGFAWTPENEARAKTIIGRYPPGRQHSASIPLLDLAQRQVGAETETQGWLPIPVIEYVANYLDMPYVRAYEVATFYTMFNKRPVGDYFVQVCTNVCCSLCGGDEVYENFLEHVGVDAGEVSPDGAFTVIEAECLGACGFPTAVQINERYFENVTAEDVPAIIERLRRERTQANSRPRS